jgi:hypothetical protein
MINVGFTVNSSEELMGKSNYLKNLIFAIASLKKKISKSQFLLARKKKNKLKLSIKNMLL